MSANSQVEVHTISYRRSMWFLEDFNGARLQGLNGS
jgi:hypothetical protein